MSLRRVDFRASNCDLARRSYVQTEGLVTRIWLKIGRVLRNQIAGEQVSQDRTALFGDHTLIGHCHS